MLTLLHVLHDEPEIDNLDLVILYSKVVRLYIFVQVAMFVNGHNSIEHLKKNFRDRQFLLVRFLYIVLD